MESLTSPKKSSKPALSELWRESSRAQRTLEICERGKGKGESDGVTGRGDKDS